MTEKDYQTNKYNRSDASCDSNFDVTSDDAQDFADKAENKAEKDNRNKKARKNITNLDL